MASAQAINPRIMRFGDLLYVHTCTYMGGWRGGENNYAKKGTGLRALNIILLYMLPQTCRERLQ